MSKLLLSSSWALISLSFACGGGGSAKFPARGAGCEVELAHGAPKVDSENIGTVNATCSEETSEELCLRELKDAVCKLGGDIAWGVSEKPEKVGDKVRYTARAAKAKSAP